MGKKRTLAIILLLCVLGGLIACGRKEKEDEYTYTIKLNDNASGSKQFSSCGYLWVYSVTDQMFTKYGNGEMPSSWTVGDTYIFFTTEQKNGGMDSSYKLWRCNKATNECEFLGDMSSDASLNIHENYLFLAFGKDKVWLMPGGRGFWGEDQSGRTVGRKRWRFRKIRIGYCWLSWLEHLFV